MGKVEIIIAKKKKKISEVELNLGAEQGLE